MTATAHRAATAGDLLESYAVARRIAARHGRSYFLATRLLPPQRRSAVHALYALARVADDLVDNPAPGASVPEITARLSDLEAALQARAASFRVLLAANDTIDRYGIDRQLFSAFFESMRMDLTVSTYADFAALRRYTYGSAEVVGLQLLPILGTVGPGAESFARDLGLAFQLTNFVRDVDEDLRRGRVYLPLVDLERFRVSVEDLRTKAHDDRVRDLIRFEVARIRAIYRRAAAGIELLDPASRECVGTALRLYAGILDAVERADYRVLDRRVSVSLPRRTAIFVPALLRSRRSHQTHHAMVSRTRENPKSKSSTGA